MPAPSFRRLILIACLLILSAAGINRGAAVVAAPLPPDQPPIEVTAARAQPNIISYWGMNLYLTKRERLSNNDNLSVLATSALDAGVQWTREELPWDLIEPNPGTFNPVYDSSLKFTADRGFGIIGMLLTTPDWARDGTCQTSGPHYWCPPANVNDFAKFAGWMAERYDGDGIDDAPGSPRIAAWEIWNEPNDTQLWPNIGSGADARKRRYGEMLVAAYQAIKAADPTATVLTGGTYIYDGSCTGGCDGLNFFNAPGGVFQQVPTARQAFDVFAIHPYLPTDRPDAPGIPRIITVEGRIRNTRGWLDDPAIGRPNAPIWVTEIGWCTATGACPGGVQVSEAQQANYLIRSTVIAQQNGVQHTSWFQFEDAFNDPNRLWGNAAIVDNYDGSSYPVKPAYTAYRTLTAQLAAMTPAGPGPIHTHIYDPSQPNAQSGNATFDYRYTCGTETADVLWRPADSIQTKFPVIAGKQVTRIQGDGSRQALTPVDGAVLLGLSESPILIRQAEPSQLSVSPSSLTLLAQAGDPVAQGGLLITNSGCESVAWSASTSSGALTLDATNATTPGSLIVTTDTQGLSNGTYMLGNITITGANGTGTFEIPVQVKVVTKLYRDYLPTIHG